jgi:O-antigen ligase
LPRNPVQINASALPFWLLTAFLALVFLTGGASRIDAQSLLILRPVSILFCALALLTLRRDHLRGRGWLLAGFGALFALILLHLIPLPPSIWKSLSGREILTDVEQMVGLVDVWRPLTLTPMNAWHALLSLFAPLAILLLGVQLDRNQLFRLLMVLLALGALSGFLGLLQVIGSADGPLYFYRYTNNGSAVGLFANRNHAAVFLACLFPILAVFASTSEGTIDEQRGRLMFAAAIGVVLIPLILVTGSRSGMFAAVIALGAAAVLYRKPQDGRAARRGARKFSFGPVPVVGGVIVLCLVFLTIFFSRATSIDRLFQQTAGEDERADFWVVGVDMFWHYFPFGSGAGSFVEAYQIFEPTRLLDSTYLNRAHNDWLETGITFGLPGLLLLAAIIAFYLWHSFTIWRHGNPDRRSIRFARMSGILMAIIALASFSDYPLRTPIMMCVMMILTLWFQESNRDAIGLNSPNSSSTKQEDET